MFKCSGRLPAPSPAALSTWMSFQKRAFRSRLNHILPCPQIRDSTFAKIVCGRAKPLTETHTTRGRADRVRNDENTAHRIPVHIDDFPGDHTGGLHVKDEVRCALAG